MPQRIQLSRRAGWRKPSGAITVARPSRWGNPFVVHASRSRGDVARQFERALRAGDLAFTVDDVRRELTGRDLACWCPLEDEHGNRVPCHADVLLRVANSSR